jgi:hypothetical protein
MQSSNPAILQPALPYPFPHGVTLFDEEFPPATNAGSTCRVTPLYAAKPANSKNQTVHGFTINVLFPRLSTCGEQPVSTQFSYASIRQSDCK